MKPGIRKAARVIGSLLVGILILWLITRGQDTELILEEFRTANYHWILLAMVCALLSHFLRGMRWNMLIRTMGYPARPFQTFYAVMTGYLANLALPRMGEITRCITLGKASGTPVNALVGTVLAERFFDFITLVVLVFFTIVFQFNFLADFLQRMFWEPLIVRGSQHWATIVLIGAAGLTLLAMAGWVIKKKLTNPAPNTAAFKIKRQLKGLIGGFNTIRTMKGKVWFLGYTILIWGFYFLTVYLCFFALPSTAHLTPIAGITLLAVGSLGILAPVPGGIGTYHFLTIISLTELYSLATEPATSYAYITHATQISVNIIAGSLAWVIISIQHRSAKTQKSEK